MTVPLQLTRKFVVVGGRWPSRECQAHGVTGDHSSIRSPWTAKRRFATHLSDGHVRRAPELMSFRVAAAAALIRVQPGRDDARPEAANGGSGGSSISSGACSRQSSSRPSTRSSSSRPDRRIVYYNERFLDIWDVPAEVMAGASSEEAIAARAATSSSIPTAFAERARIPVRHPLERSHEELLFRDGRVLERFSGPGHG